MSLDSDYKADIDSKLLHSSISIIKSSNPHNNGKNGKLVSISKNMIVLKSDTLDKIIKIPKIEISKYRMTTKQGIYVLPGKRLLGRPEEVKDKIK
jgi:RNase P/RNase MRP subunit p29